MRTHAHARTRMTHARARTGRCSARARASGADAHAHVWQVLLRDERQRTDKAVKETDVLLQKALKLQRETDDEARWLGLGVGVGVGLGLVLGLELALGS